MTAHQPSTLSPTTLAEAAAALAETTGRVGITGAGTASDWAGTLEPVEVVLDTTKLRGVLSHNPADMTVEVRAGTPLRELNEFLAQHGQQVALDAARVRRGATIGGLIATADSGPMALAFGSLRDLVIGAVLVLADGTTARTGGHVIKNVAGYDLAKLVHGCYGNFALIAQVVLRLHPRPEASATVALPCALDEAVAASAGLLSAPLEPVAIEWCANQLLVRISGSRAALDARASRVERALGSGARTLPEPEAEAAWAHHASLVDTAPPGDAMLRVGVRPSRLAPLLTELTESLDAHQITAGLATGIATLALAAEPARIAEAHQRVHAYRGSSSLRAHPADRDLPAWGPAPSALSVLRALRIELDPEGRLGTGRFTPWLDKTEVT